MFTGLGHLLLFFPTKWTYVSKQTKKNVFRNSWNKSHIVDQSMNKIVRQKCAPWWKGYKDETSTFSYQYFEN